MEENIVVSLSELQRSRVLEEVVSGKMALMRAAELLGVSYRQAKRLKARYRREGIAGLVHGNRGRIPVNALSEEARRVVVELHEQRYGMTNDTHFTELLEEREEIRVSRETVRKLLRGAGKAPKRRRRPPRHRSRRQRKERMGVMLQWDGSPHRWFGADHPPCCLMAAVDDATSTLVAAFLAPAECSEAYLRLLAMVLRRHGLPMATYHDRHSSLVRSDDYWSHEEQLQGYQFPTHVGRVLAELGIESISANSPQAKGRIERSFGILQDRLLAELQLNGITDIDSANTWIETTFIDRYNTRFAESAQVEDSAFVPISEADIHHHVAFAYEATVGNDNAIRLGGIVIDIPPGPQGRSYAKATVLVRQHLDGSWTVSHGKSVIASHTPTPFREPIRTWKTRQRRHNTAHTFMQVYISSKPAPFSRGTFSLGS